MFDRWLVLRHDRVGGEGPGVPHGRTAWEGGIKLGSTTLYPWESVSFKETDKSGWQGDKNCPLRRVPRMLFESTPERTVFPPVSKITQSASLELPY